MKDVSFVNPIYFWKRVDKNGEGGCWLWTGQRNKDGYGRFSQNYRGKGYMFTAHRVTYELLVGRVPEGLEIDHLCRVRHCCNPDHLEAVTHSENMRRAILTVFPRTRDEQDGLPICANGHPLTEANRWARSDRPEQVLCRECGRAKNHRAYLRRVARAKGVSHPPSRVGTRCSDA